MKDLSDQLPIWEEVYCIETMSIHLRYRSVVLLLINVGLCLTQSKSLEYDTIVSFGDANSDTGNTYKLTGNQWPPPPYYLGRFSDGPLWVERLNVSNLLNYAYADATTDSEWSTDNIPGTNLTAPGLRQQINMYKNSTNLRQTDYSRTLYVIWIGLFDYFGDGDLNASTIIRRLSRGIDDLIRIGAKTLLVVNQPPFRAYPGLYNGEMGELFDLWTSEHNDNLSQSIENFRKNLPQTTFHLLDVHSLIRDILVNSSAFGITNVTNCWSTFNGTIIPLCSNSNTFLFLDEFYFTTSVHQLIADRARNLLLTSNGRIPYAFSSALLMMISAIVWSKNFI